MLHYFARRLASDPRTEINARIVVVGLSTCAVGMLKALLLSSSANVKRVTLISEPGISRASGVVVDEDYPEPFEFEALGLLSVSFLVPSAFSNGVPVIVLTFHAINAT